MLNMLKNKKCLVVSALVLLLSFPAKATKLIDLGVGNKYDFFDKSINLGIGSQYSLFDNFEPGKDTPLGKLSKKIEELGGKEEWKWQNTRLGFAAIGFMLDSGLVTEKAIEGMYNNGVLDDYFSHQETYTQLEVAEFKRDKKVLPEPFVKIAHLIKEHIKKYYELDEFSLYNFTGYTEYANKHGSYYDIENEVAVLDLPEISLFVYDPSYYDYNKKLVIDVPLEKMKKISPDSNVRFAIHISYEKEKGALWGVFDESPGELMLKGESPKWKIKAVSSTMRGFYFVHNDFFDKGSNNRNYSESDKEVDSSLEVKNPRICPKGRYHSDECVKLEVSDSF